jgi:hypothetical protein
MFLPIRKRLKFCLRHPRSPCNTNSRLLPSFFSGQVGARPRPHRDQQLRVGQRAKLGNRRLSGRVRIKNCIIIDRIFVRCNAHFEEELRFSCLLCLMGVEPGSIVIICNEICSNVCSFACHFVSWRILFSLPSEPNALCYTANIFWVIFQSVIGQVVDAFSPPPPPPLLLESPFPQSRSAVATKMAFENGREHLGRY